ncbi:hypothetical protein BH20ACT16_BH20ACT16_00810 [soil metagenome]
MSADTGMGCTNSRSALGSAFKRGTFAVSDPPEVKLPVVRRTLAVLPVAAVAMAASSAQAAEVKTLPCVPYIAGQQTMPVVAAGFAPNNFATFYTNSTASPTPRILTSGRLDGIGGFTGVALPPPFTKTNGNLETFNLIGEDKTNPAAPVVVTTPFQVVRFGMTRSPAPKRPRQKVTFTARGFVPDKRVYAHFRFKGVTRRTVSLGIAKGPCGITSLKMRALPTKVRYGTWRAYIDQTKKFSVATRPQWIDPFTITRVLRGN